MASLTHPMSKLMILVSFLNLNAIHESIRGIAPEYSDHLALEGSPSHQYRDGSISTMVRVFLTEVIHSINSLRFIFFIQSINTLGFCIFNTFFDLIGIYSLGYSVVLNAIVKPNINSHSRRAIWDDFILPFPFLFHK